MYMQVYIYTCIGNYLIIYNYILSKLYLQLWITQVNLDKMIS